MTNGARKVFYIFLTALLGALLFLILHRIAVFLYFVILAESNDFLTFGLSGIEFLALEYITMVFALLGGVWYGIWIGSYWYEAVYESNIHGGLLEHLLYASARVKPSYQPGTLKTRISHLTADVARDLEKGLWELEDLSKEVERMPVTIKPTVKPTVRKRVARKTVK